MQLVKVGDLETKIEVLEMKEIESVKVEEELRKEIHVLRQKTQVLEKQNQCRFIQVSLVCFSTACFFFFFVMRTKIYMVRWNNVLAIDFAVVVWILPLV